jgi:hypothetical protein
MSYRRSKKVGPLRFTVSQRGISTSIGGGPLRFSYGADGKVRRTIRAPGTGFYDTRVIGGKTPPSRRKASAAPTAEDRAATLALIKAYSPSQNELLRYFGLQLLWPTMLFGWLIYWLFSVGLWFLGVGAIIGIFIAAVKSTAKRQRVKVLEAYAADHETVTRCKGGQARRTMSSTADRCGQGARRS